MYEQIRRGDTADAGARASRRLAFPFRQLRWWAAATSCRPSARDCAAWRGVPSPSPARAASARLALAIEAAHSLRYDFEDGVYFVELAALNDTALVADAIARQLGVQERPRQPIGETLREHLRAKQLLLVLDNFEHVVSAAPLVSGLLAACPALVVLVTSRAPLGIRDEQQFALEPLSDGDAVRLFVQRAQAVGAGLAADDAGAGVYAAICRQLDRLPLAIELAAARSKLFGRPTLLALLSARLELLTGGARDVPARQQTIRATLDWSYRLLAPAEQPLFARLAVFVGGCSMQAAEAVCGADSGAAQQRETASAGPPVALPTVLDGLAALVDHSLLQRADGADGAPRVPHARDDPRVCR